MSNYISWDDFFRFFKFFPYKFPLFNERMSGILIYKDSASSFSKTLKAYYDNILREFGVPNVIDENYLGRLMVNNINNKMALDVNVFFMSVIYSLRSFRQRGNNGDQKEVERLNKLFYKIETEEDALEYKRGIKRLLISIKKDYIEKMDSKIISYDIHGEKEGRYTPIEIINTINWVIHNYDNIVESFSCINDINIYKDINIERLILYLADTSINELIHNGVDPKNDDYINVIKNYKLFYELRSKDEDNYKVQVKARCESIQGVNINSYETYRKICAYLKVNSQDNDDLTIDSFETLILSDYKQAKLKEMQERKRQEEIAKYRESLVLSWELAPSSEDTGISRILSSRRSKKSIEEINKLTKKAQELLEKKLSVFENSGYIACLNGINQLEGYVAHIYPSGLVLMEKFYKMVHGDLVPTMNEAIYMMDYDTFKCIGGFDKMHLREALKNADDPNMRVINHTKNFEEKIKKIINSIDYNEEIVDYILSEISKLKGKELKNG